MRTWITITLIAISLACFGQWKPQPLPLSLTYCAGAFKGTADYLQFHYSGQNTWLNPDLSWRNKWRNGDPSQGEKFPGSSTVFVCFTDGWHLCNAINKTAIIGAICLKIGAKKQPFKYYLLDFLTYSAAYSAGFWCTYELLSR